MPDNATHLHDLFAFEDSLGSERSTELLFAEQALLAGRSEQALAIVAEELRQHPQNPSALVLSADIFNVYGKGLQALELIQRARASAPSVVTLRVVEAEQLLRLGRFEEARLLLEQLLRDGSAANPPSFLLHVCERLGRAFQGLQRPQQALKALEPLLNASTPAEVDPSVALLAAELTLALRRPEQALPWAAHAHGVLGTAPSARLLARCHFLLNDQHSYAQLLVEASATSPQDGELAALACLALFDLPAVEEGWSLLQRVGQQAGSSPALRFVEARQRLLRGDFSLGWLAYEARLELAENNLYAPCPPGWREQSPTGRAVVVVAEQGVGDILFLARFLLPLLEDASRVLLLVPSRLIALLQRSYPEVVVLVKVELAQALGGPEALWIPLGSLPLLYGRDQSAITRGARQPQLRLKERLQEHWRLHLDAEAGPRPRVGISLSAGGMYQDYQNRKRSVDYDIVLNPLRGLPVTLIDLQHRDRLPSDDGGGATAVQLHFEEITSDLDHLCALMANLDLLITSDQTNAFLGGMLGIKTMVIVPPNPHFMLMDQGCQTPWFDSLRIIRAPRWRDWESIANDYEAQLTQTLDELGV